MKRNLTLQLLIAMSMVLLSTSALVAQQAATDEAEPADCDCDCGEPILCIADVDCDDGNYCNGTEICVEGQCLQDPAGPLQCDDGNVCNGVEFCSPKYGCELGDPLVVDDGLTCNGKETCDPIDGVIAGTPITCDADACQFGIAYCSEEEGGECVCAPHPCDKITCPDGETCNYDTAQCEGKEPPVEPCEDRPNDPHCQMETLPVDP